MMHEKDYTKENAKTIDQWVEEGWIWGIPISHEVYEKAVNGEWEMVLTPTKPVPKSWFPELKGKKILGLASGGGQQMPIFAALGGICTVLDYSDRQLASEEMVAKREGYDIEIVKADMTKNFPFADETFDLIFHPVSNCYVEEVLPVWKECYRVLLPYNPLKDRKLYEEAMQSGDGIQFSHTVEEQIGGLLKAGFCLTHLYEDTNGEGNLHEHGIPTFLAVRAEKET